ncbi:MAG: two component transcriptional regulator, winged helix family protein [Armatimonadetes bacterium]|nr:two component transcriptional regulator, winged helix family protein [Armatimonadota bacterium]
MSRILIADDDPSIRELCQVILSNEGFQVLEAEDAVGCVELARASRPDLVLLDWMMPEIDGMDALRMLKEHASTSSIPVVMLTALDGLPQISLATFNGADGYVTKPFEVEDLLSLVRRFLQAPASSGA